MQRGYAGFNAGWRAQVFGRYSITSFFQPFPSRPSIASLSRTFSRSSAIGGLTGVRAISPPIYFCGARVTRPRTVIVPLLSDWDVGVREAHSRSKKVEKRWLKNKNRRMRKHAELLRQKVLAREARKAAWKERLWGMRH